MIDPVKANVTKLRRQLAGYLEDGAVYASHGSKWAAVSDFGVQSCQIAINTLLFGPDAMEQALAAIPTTKGDLTCDARPSSL